MESHRTLAVNSPPRKKTRGGSVVEENHDLLQKYCLSALCDPDASKLLQNGSIDCWSHKGAFKTEWDCLEDDFVKSHEQEFGELPSLNRCMRQWKKVLIPYFKELIICTAVFTLYIM